VKHAFAAGIVALVFATSAASRAQQPTALSDALRLEMQNEILEAVEIGDRVWIVRPNGQLQAYNIADGNLTSQSANENYFRVVRQSQNELWTLRWRERPTQNAERTAILARQQGAELIEYPPITVTPQIGLSALVLTNDGPLVLTQTQILRRDDRSWRAMPLTHQLPGGFSRANALLADGRTLYLGFDNGEWGGGMQRVNLSTGAVDRVDRRETGSLCAGPLNSACDPVTGVIADQSHPGCVIASVGLAHMFMQTGRILRVCGLDVRTVFTREVPEPHDELPPNTTRIRLPHQTTPIYALAPALGGFWAMTEDSMLRFSNDSINSERRISLSQRGDLRIDQSFPDLLLLSGPPASTLETKAPGMANPVQVRIGGQMPYLVAATAQQ
jgi:hypothetical protein